MSATKIYVTVTQPTFTTKVGVAVFEGIEFTHTAHANADFTTIAGALEYQIRQHIFNEVQDRQLSNSVELVLLPKIVPVLKNHDGQISGTDYFPGNGTREEHERTRAAIKKKLDHEYRDIVFDSANGVYNKVTGVPGYQTTEEHRKEEEIKVKENDKRTKIILWVVVCAVNIVAALLVYYNIIKK